MGTFPSEEQANELRRLWRTLAGLRRGAKGGLRFKAIHRLSPIETGVLDIAAEKPDVILGEIGAALKLPKSTLTSMLDRLEAQGYLRRVISQRDRRSYGIELTSKGRTAYEVHSRFEAEVWSRTLAGLDNDAEREGFLIALRKIVAGIEPGENHE